MTVNDLIKKTGFQILSLTDGSKKIEGFYAGDLLSRVLAQAPVSCCFATVMANVNVLAVASLSDFACVVVCEGIKPHQTFIETAAKKEINVLSAETPLYETCIALYTAAKG